MFSLNCKKHSFTLMEVIIICSLFAVMVIWIIFAINRAFVFMDNTRLAVRASNLAREWVEMVYNLRDSNWEKYSWSKDAHRLDDWAWWTLWQWIYCIKDDLESVNWDSYVYAESLEGISDIDEFYEIEWFFDDAYADQREKSKIIFTGTYSYYSWWTLMTGWDISELVDVDGLEFYRVLRVYWIENKWASCPSSEGEHCPKELRFCVKIFYRNIQWQHASELCSIMTNFQE